MFCRSKAKFMAFRKTDFPPPIGATPRSIHAACSDEFGANGKYAVIVNGHKPVRVKDGEMPESGNCRHITIDGGLSKAYSLKTGIGGYTLISNSEGLYLVSHEPGFSVEGVFNGNSDLKSFNRLLKKYDKSILVKETDDGKAMDKQIQVLKNLLKYYNKR